MTSDKHLNTHQAFDAKLDGGLCTVAVNGADVGVLAGLHEGAALVAEGEQKMAWGAFQREQVSPNRRVAVVYLTIYRHLM